MAVLLNAISQAAAGQNAPPRNSLESFAQPETVLALEAFEAAKAGLPESFLQDMTKENPPVFESNE